MRSNVLLGACLVAATALTACQPVQPWSPDPDGELAKTRAELAAGTKALNEKSIAAAADTVPADYKARIDHFWETQLKDPYSRHVEMKDPVGGVVCGHINAKNAFGGYTGAQPFLFVFDHSGGFVRAVIESDGDMETINQAQTIDDVGYDDRIFLQQCRLL